MLSDDFFLKRLVTLQKRRNSFAGIAPICISAHVVCYVSSQRANGCVD